MGAHLSYVRIPFFGKGGNTTNKSVHFYLLVLHKVSNDISNIDHFVSIHISYRKKISIPSPNLYPFRYFLSILLYNYMFIAFLGGYNS